jgi:hypothetical protein
MALGGDTKREDKKGENVKAKGTKRKEKGNIVVKRQNKRLGTYKGGYKGA